MKKKAFRILALSRLCTVSLAGCGEKPADTTPKVSEKESTGKSIVCS